MLSASWQQVSFRWLFAPQIGLLSCGWIEYLGKIVSLHRVEARIKNGDATNILQICISLKQPTRFLTLAYLIDFDHYKQIVILEVDLMTWANNLRNLLYNAVTAQDVVVPQRWSDGELLTPN